MGVHSKAIPKIISPDDYIRYEIPVGVINGTNDTFGILNPPVLGTVEVFYNGILQAPIFEYNIVGQILTMIKPPRTGRDFYIHYIKLV